MATDTFDSHSPLDSARGGSGQAPSRSVQSLIRSTQTDIAMPDREQARSALEHYTATGDVSRMTDAQRAAFILYYCERIGLEAATGCIEIVEFDVWDAATKTTQQVAKVYVKAEAAKQLGFKHRIRVETLSEEMVGKSHFKVVVRGHDLDGRTYDEVGYVSLLDRNGRVLEGSRYSNQLMKCHTVAKRRLILGMIGLSAPPEPGEATGIRRRYLGPNGELLEAPSEEERYLNDHPKAAAISGRPRFETMQQPQPPDADAPLRPHVESAPEPRAHSPLDSARGGSGQAETERPSFKPSDADIARWQGAYFAAVTGTSLHDDDGRQRYVEQWTDGRTASLRNFLASATERQAHELIEHARVLADDERAAIEAASQPDENNDTEF